MFTPAQVGRRPSLLFHVAVTLLAGGLSACATIAHGTNQVVPIVSSPAGARVAIDSVPIGQTPLLATVSRSRSHTITVSKDSAPPVAVALNRHLSPALLGHLFIYAAPIVVDFATG